MSALAKPAVRVPFRDPEFGSTVVRITDVRADTGFVGGRVPMYSTVPAWNADESYLIIYQTHAYSESGLPSRHLLYDGASYRFIRELDIDPSDVEHLYWDAKDPDVFYYPRTYEASGRPLRQLIRYHVHAARKEVVHDIACSGRIDFGHPKYMAWDGLRVGMRCRGKWPAAEAFVLNIANGQETARAKNDHDWGFAVGPSGTTALLGGEAIDTGTLRLVRSLRTNTIEHGTLAPLANGDDAFVSAQYDGAFVGNVVSENLRSGEIRVLVGRDTGWRHYPPVTTHISAVAFRRPGWMAVSIEGEHAGREPLDQELLLVDVNSGRVCRAAHHHSQSTSGPRGYWAEPHAVISPSATRILFGSDWGGTDAVDSYVVELPSYRAAK